MFENEYDTKVFFCIGFRVAKEWLFFKVFPAVFHSTDTSSLH